MYKFEVCIITISQIQTMFKHSVVLLFIVFLTLASIISLVCETIESNNESSKIHIVYMGSLPKETSYSSTSHHISLLQQVINASDIQNCLARSYKKNFNGFAAILNNQQRKKLAGMKGVISVFPSQEYHLKTSRAWDFIGLPQSIKRHQIVESDLVIGVIDTGIWPESESFNDKGIDQLSRNTIKIY
jgi:hypothetical protein